MGVEHPVSANGVVNELPDTAVCGIAHIPPLVRGARSDNYTAVVGVCSEASQARRCFNEYLLKVRTFKLKPMLHYNSWFDFLSWQEPNVTMFRDRRMTEQSCLDRVRAFGRELVSKRHVKMDSFLWDDGWDDHRTLWGFNDGFPNGFTNVGEAAKKIGSGIGVWTSPMGGYSTAKAARLAYGVEQGYQINEMGFKLSDKKYFDRFREISLKMVREYGVNMFKFDGVNFQGEPHLYAEEADAMLRLVRQLREEAENDDLFINLTTGTWPSPFWLLYADSIWRGYTDLGTHGEGTVRQQWITFRDGVVYQNVVRRAKLFPLPALMLHGIVSGAVGESRYWGLDHVSTRDFSDEVSDYERV